MRRRLTARTPAGGYTDAPEVAVSEIYNPTSHTRARVAAQVPAEVDVAIIGAGLGGLMTAARLAKAGQKVAVFDAHYVAGGCATMFTRGSGEDRVNFDIGLHYVGACDDKGRIPRLLREVGVEVEWEPLDPDGFDEFVFPDFRFRVPADRDLYRERLLALFPSEKAGIDRYIRALTEVRVLSRESAPKGWRLGVEALLKARLAAWYKGATLGAFLDTCTKDPKLRAVIAGQNGDYGLGPSKVSLMLHCGLANHYFDGAYYPKGGGQIIADRLSEVIEAAGGTIHLRHPVDGVVVEGGRATGLRYRGQHGASSVIRAKTVVSNADLKRTLLELVPDVPAPLKEQAQAWEMGGAIFLTCLAVKADLGKLGMARTNYWQFDGYDFDALYTEGSALGALPPVRGCYITSATRKDPTTRHHAPPGVETVEVMALMPGTAEAWGVDTKDVATPKYRKAEVYQGHKQRVQDDLVARLERLFPGSTKEIVHIESATPVTHSRFTGASAGSGYGLAATPGQFLGNRPGVRSHLPGMYYTGANTRSGHGIVGALASGVHTAAAIQKDK